MQTVTCALHEREKGVTCHLRLSDGTRVARRSRVESSVTPMPPCEIYIVRHAIVAERGPEWPDDTQRPLTERGISRFKDSVAGLKPLDATIDEIFSSPLVRAKQTADILPAGILGHSTVKLLDALAPGHSPAVVMAQLAKAAKRRRIAIVGHEPDLGELAAYL